MAWTTVFAWARSFGRSAWPVRVLVLAVCALTVVRCGALFLEPTLAAEDGKRVLAYFYENRGLSEILRWKAGYVALLPNVIGFTAVRLPIEWAPRFLTIAPAFVTVLVFTLFASSAFQPVVPSRGVRILACLAMALAPVGTYFFVCHTDYSIWNALFLLLLLSLAPGSRRPLGAATGFLARAFLIWSHPLTFVALPVHAFRMLRDRGVLPRVAAALLIPVQLAHLAFGLSPRRARAQGETLFEPEFWLERLTLAARHVSEDVLPRALLGLGGERGPTFALFLTAATLGAVALVVALGPKLTTRSTYLILGYLTAALSLAVFASEVQNPGSSRYAYVQTLLCVLLVSLLVAELVTRFLPNRAVARAGLGLAVLVYPAILCVDSLENYRDPRHGNGERIANCVKELAALERANGGPCGFTFHCKKRHDWSFQVEAPACPAEPQMQARVWSPQYLPRARR
jgi:hypothetical protein